MTIIARVYVGLAFIILGSSATFFSIATWIYRIIYKDEDLAAQSLANIFTISGLTLIFSAFSMGLYRVDAMNKHHRRQMAFGSVNRDPDRLQIFQHFRRLRLFAPVFSWSWRLATLIYVTLCVALVFSTSLNLAFTTFVKGFFMYQMVFVSSFLVPSIIRSLEIIAGSATAGDIPTS